MKGNNYGIQIAIYVSLHNCVQDRYEIHKNINWSSWSLLKASLSIINKSASIEGTVVGSRIRPSITVRSRWRSDGFNISISGAVDMVGKQKHTGNSNSVLTNRRMVNLLT